MKDIQLLLLKRGIAGFRRYNETPGKIAAGEKINELITRARENERELIGRELHDNVNQILSTVKLFLEMLHPQKSDEKYIRDKSIGYVRMAIEEIRKISKELVITKQEAKGVALAESIRTMIDDIHFSTSIRITFRCHPRIEFLAQDRKITLLRIIQEQLKNIVSYSKAKQVSIRLDICEENVMMEIKDNGVGFDASKKSNGIGFSNIYERTLLYNGTVDLRAEEGKGCALLISLPAA